MIARDRYQTERPENAERERERERILGWFLLLVIEVPVNQAWQSKLSKTHPEKWF